MKAALLGGIFLLEVALLAAAGFWGGTLDAGWPVRLLAGLGAPLVMAVVWGLFCSPRATVRLPAPAKLGVQSACFLTGGVLLTLTGHFPAGAVLVLLWAVTKMLLTRAAPDRGTADLGSGGPLRGPFPSKIWCEMRAKGHSQDSFPERPIGRTLRR
ncbi:YrdB family protein [Micromonospora sp. NBC_01392]|uniref:YrdB family protein n=1 Tax=Micromonospora sp. NBC_01392 TaxID=2903588 RepID=UPI00324F4B9C